jgi:DNA polymerase-1
VHIKINGILFVKLFNIFNKCGFPLHYRFAQKRNVMSAKKRVFLIDGSAVFYRSYFALIRNPLITSKGVNVSAVYGFLNTIFKIMIDEKPDYVAIVFDTGHPTFRHDIYKDYKATREKMPDDLRDQLPLIHQISEHLNIPILELPGYEADDIIGTISNHADKKDIEAFLVSGDKDFMQLITDNVKMYAVGRSGSSPDITWYDEVEQKFGVHPSKVIDVLGLMGDSSDNVPGVQGIGPKTASKLIKEYGSMEQLYERIDELKPSKNKERLIEQKEMALLSKELVTIDINVPIEYTFDAMIPNNPNVTEIKAFFEQMEFKNRIPSQFDNYLRAYFGKEDDLSFSLEKLEREVKIERETNYTTITNASEFKMMLMKIKSFKCAFDTETTSLESLNCDLVGISFSYEKDQGYYLPFNGDFVKENRESVLGELKEYFENDLFQKIGHNIKYDCLVLSQYGIRVQGIYFDTMIANYILNPSGRNHKLDAMSEKFLNHEMIPISDLIGKGKNQKTMDEIEIDTVAEYACEDADITLQLYEILEPKIKLENLENVFYNIEIPLISTLIETEKNGVRIDVDFLSDMSERLKSRIDEIIKEIYSLAGEEFNLNSPRQLGPILFEKMEIHKAIGKRPPKKTKTGQYSTAEDQLLKFDQHEIIQLILEYRELTKLKSTYVDAIPNLVNPKTNAVHTSFNQTIAATGRLSSTDPNFQNIPIRTELGREIRKAFIPKEKNWKILSADYSQIELRLVAHISEDQNMIDAFNEDLDIHTATAARMFKVDLKDVDSDMRRKAKEINFGIIYGMSQWGLAARLDISGEEAKSFIDNYFIEYPGIHNYMMNTISDSRRDQFVTTLGGRKRFIPEINSDNRMIREGAERVAINTPIQGTAADLIKIAMINVQNEIEKRNLKSQMILQVHDELVFEVPEEEIDELTELVNSLMSSAMEVSVPLKVESGVGNHWLEAH